MVAERISAAGSGYIQNNFVRIMQESADLRHEPEFADLYLDSRQTLEAATRHFPHFSQRMMQMSHMDGETAATTYDEYRIAVLNDLDTPQLRRELQQRLNRCMDRCNRGRDVDKMEIALLLSALFSDQAEKLVQGVGPLPLGVYGLVTMIYEDSFSRAMEEVPLAREIIGDALYELWCIQHRKRDMDVIAAAVERIGEFAELTNLLGTDSTLALAWKRQELVLVRDLQEQILLKGVRLGPDFFTRDEAALALDKIEQRHLQDIEDPVHHLKMLSLDKGLECIRETLDEIVSPQRIAAMLEELKSVGQDYLKARDKRLRSLVPHVQAAICHLQSEKTPSQNRVVTTLYLQIVQTLVGG